MKSRSNQVQMYRQPAAFAAACNRQRRRGVSVTELIVAGSLLISTMSLVATGAVGTIRLLRDGRHIRIAAYELSNQLETLIDLPAEELDAALADLTPAAHVAHTLAGADITGTLVDDIYGERIVLRLNWNRSSVSKPLVMTGWVRALPAANEATETEALESQTK